MKHIFDVELATKYGVNCAVILENLHYWIIKNEANGVNFHDGRYWTYNSRKAMAKLFPYLSERQIETTIKKLIDAGLVVTGNYNNVPYDRTLWYALTDEGIALFKNVKSISPKCEMENDEMLNGTVENVKPIPNINTNKKPNINSKKERKKKANYDEMVAGYTNNVELTEALKAFIQMRVMMKKPLTDRAFKLLLDRLDKFGHSDSEKVEMLNNAVMNNWLSVYPLKNNSKPKQGNDYNPNGYTGFDDPELAKFYGESFK